MYKKTADDNLVIRVSDGAFIDRGHREWMQYEGWLGAGNTPLPADPVDCLPSNIEALWQAAHDYEYAQISGSAIGMLALGVAANKPKALAVQAWLKSIWGNALTPGEGLYYDRKALVTGDAPIDPALLDFSSCGPIPHTVSELMVEAGF